MRVTMIGAGYVGLVSGACFADFGHEVTCIDKDDGKIAALKRSEVPIFDPDLDQLVKTGSNAGRLKFTTTSPAALPRQTRCSSPSARPRRQPRKTVAVLGL